MALGTKSAIVDQFPPEMPVGHQSPDHGAELRRRGLEATEEQRRGDRNQLVLVQPIIVVTRLYQQIEKVVGLPLSPFDDECPDEALNVHVRLVSLLEG